MYIWVQPDSEGLRWELRDRDNFRSLDMIVDASVSDTEVRELCEAHGQLFVDGCLRISGVSLRSLVGVTNAEWQAKFDAMLAFAQSHGWVDEAGYISVHRVAGLGRGRDLGRATD